MARRGPKEQPHGPPCSHPTAIAIPPMVALEISGLEFLRGSWRVHPCAQPEQRLFSGRRDHRCWPSPTDLAKSGFHYNRYKYTRSICPRAEQWPPAADRRPYRKTMSGGGKRVDPVRFTSSSAAGRRTAHARGPGSMRIEGRAQRASSSLSATPCLFASYLLARHG